MKRKKKYKNVTIFMKGERKHRRKGRNKRRRNRGSPSNAQKCSTELNWTQKCSSEPNLPSPPEGGKFPSSHCRCRDSGRTNHEDHMCRM